MRLLIFNLYFHPDPTGTGLTTSELARDLARRGHEVVVVTTIPHYGLDEAPREFRGRWIHEETWEGVRVFRTAVPVARRKTMLARIASYLSYAALGWIAGLRGPRPDVVMGILPPITTGPTMWLVSLARHAPLVLNVQDVYPDAIFRGRGLAWINRAIERFLLARATRITALSETQREMLLARGADPRARHRDPHVGGSRGRPSRDPKRTRSGRNTARAPRSSPSTPATWECSAASVCCSRPPIGCAAIHGSVSWSWDAGTPATRWCVAPRSSGFRT